MSYSIIGHLAPAARLALCVVALASAAGCHHSRPPIATSPAGDDQVNVGYGTQPRRAVAGAIESTTREELADRPASRVEEMLEGRFSGLDVVRLPSGEYRLRIRGSTRDPLVVVDGIPSPAGLTNPLSFLMPANVARVEVLKGGSAAAYGVRGTNGVILITTRRGR